MDKKEFNLVYPVTKVRLYPTNGTLEVKRESKIQGKPKPGKRQEIKYLSQRSLSRLAFLVSESSIRFASILTLTYSKDFPVEGLTVKRDWNRLRTYLFRLNPKFDYLWFLEFQRRGAPHLHVLLSFKPSEWIRHRVAMEWSLIVLPGIVSRETILERKKIYRVHNHPDQWQIIRKKDGAKRYAMKYALKANQKMVPENFRDVGRFWGCSRSVKASIEKPLEKEITGEELVAFLHDIGHRTSTWEWLPRYIFLVGGEEEKKILKEY